MQELPIESSYPLAFRSKEAAELGQHLKHQHSVVLIGMKRVGISNFLHFFLYHPDVTKTYIADGKKHLFIPVDLNDLVEREIYPFWMLTLKRILDAVENSTLDNAVKKYIETLFLESIQSKNLFLLIESVRRAIIKIVGRDLIPTIFFIRFDRIANAATPEFFSNLQGLRDACHKKLTYVFTSYRPLEELAPLVFTKQSLSVFVHTMSIKPAKKDDACIIFDTLKKRYNLRLSKILEEHVLEYVDGYVQYAQLALIVLQEKKEKAVTDQKKLFQLLISDERIHLQSEEIWESLTKEEQDIAKKIIQQEIITVADKKQGEYLWTTGIVTEKNQFFSPIFSYYLEHLHDNKEGKPVVEFTKKEHMLFNFLQNCKEEVCEREKIIEEVWPEVEAFGVSDWAIDRLVARVRGKLKLSKSKFAIKTVKTRGYKLVLSE